MPFNCINTVLQVTGAYFSGQDCSKFSFTTAAIK
jgi:hypothetical protein